MTNSDDDWFDLIMENVRERMASTGEVERLRSALRTIDKMGDKPWELTNADAITMLMIARSALFDQTIAEDM
jgi:hypothetical protein